MYLEPLLDFLLFGICGINYRPSRSYSSKPIFGAQQVDRLMLVWEVLQQRDFDQIVLPLVCPSKYSHLLIPASNTNSCRLLVSR